MDRDSVNEYKRLEKERADRIQEIFRGQHCSECGKKQGPRRRLERVMSADGKEITLKIIFTCNNNNKAIPCRKENSSTHTRDVCEVCKKIFWDGESDFTRQGAVCIHCSGKNPYTGLRGSLEDGFNRTYG